MNETKEKLTSEYFFKKQMIILVKLHRDSCTNPECDINCVFLYDFLSRLGVNFSKEEAQEFLG